MLIYTVLSSASLYRCFIQKHYLCLSIFSNSFYLTFFFISQVTTTTPPAVKTTLGVKTTTTRPAVKTTLGDKTTTTWSTLKAMRLTNRANTVDPSKCFS